MRKSSRCLHVYGCAGRSIHESCLYSILCPVLLCPLSRVPAISLANFLVIKSLGKELSWWWMSAHSAVHIFRIREYSSPMWTVTCVHFSFSMLWWHFRCVYFGFVNLDLTSMLHWEVLHSDYAFVFILLWAFLCQFHFHAIKDNLYQQTRTLEPSPREEGLCCNGLCCVPPRWILRGECRHVFWNCCS